MNPTTANSATAASTPTNSATAGSTRPATPQTPQVAPEAKGYAHLLSPANPADQIRDDRVRAFLKREAAPADSDEANHVAQWGLDNGEDKLCRAVLESGLVTELWLRSEVALAGVRKLWDCRALDDVQFQIPMLPDAELGADWMSDLAATFRANTALRHLCFLPSGRGHEEDDAAQLCLCFDELAAMPRLVLDVSHIKLDLASSQALLTSLAKNPSLEALSYNGKQAGPDVLGLLGTLVAQGTMTSLCLARVSFKVGGIDFLSNLSKSHTLHGLDLGRCVVPNNGGLCKALANNELPTIPTLVLPDFGARLAGLRSLLRYTDYVVDNVLRTQCLAKNTTLKQVDVSQAGYPVSVWVSQLKKNSTLEAICFPMYDFDSRGFEATYEDFRKNSTVTKVTFAPGAREVPNTRPLTEKEQALLQAVGERNLVRLQLCVHLGEVSGTGFAVSLPIPGLADSGPRIGRHVASGTDAWRDTVSLTLVNKATYLGQTKSHGQVRTIGPSVVSTIGRFLVDSLTLLSEGRRAQDEDHEERAESTRLAIAVLCHDLSLRSVTLNSGDAALMAEHPTMHQLLGKVPLDWFNNLISSLSEIGIELPKLRPALNALTRGYREVWSALNASSFDATHDHLDPFSVPELPRRSLPAVMLFVDYGVVLGSGGQFGNIQAWCNESNQPELLVAAASHAKRSALKIDCSALSVARLHKVFDRCPTVHSLVLEGSLKGDDRVPLGALLATAGTLHTLEVNLELLGSDLHYLMTAVGANASISSLTVSKPAKMNVGACCAAIGQVLRSNQNVKVVLALPQEFRDSAPVRELLALHATRLTLK